MKKLLHLTLLTITLDANAMCQAIAETFPQGARQNETTAIHSHHTAYIKNESGSAQHYDVCYEVSTQKINNTEKFTNSWCDSYNLAAGQSIGPITQNPVVNIRYGSASHDYFVNADAVTEIHGNCRSLAHDIKKIKVYR